MIDLRTVRLGFTDTETTGLDPTQGKLLEIALVITDGNLEILGQGSWFCPCDTAEAYNLADEYVRGMHTKNNLWAEHHAFMQWCSTQSAIYSVSDEMLKFAYQHGFAPSSGTPMIGNGIAFDRDWLGHHQPRIRGLWNHRVIDISGLQHLAELWYDLKYTGKVTHRALDDILESLDKLRWLRTNMFR